MPPKKSKIPDPLPTMPIAYDILRALESARNLPYNTQRAIAERRVIDRALLSVWQPRWDSLVERMKSARTNSREYLKLYAQRNRIFSAMQQASNGFPYYDEHHDWGQEAIDRLKAQVERDNVYPTIQDIDPYTSEYLPKGKTLRYSEVSSIDIARPQVAYLQDGYARADKGDARIGVVFPVQEGRKKRLRLYVYSDLLGARKIEMSHGHPYGFGRQTVQPLEDWLRFIGPRQVGDRPPESGYTVKGDKKTHGYLLYAGEYLP